MKIKDFNNAVGENYSIDIEERLTHDNFPELWYINEFYGYDKKMVLLKIAQLRYQILSNYTHFLRCREFK